MEKKNVLNTIIHQTVGVTASKTITSGLHLLQQGVYSKYVYTLSLDNARWSLQSGISHVFKHGQDTVSVWNSSGFENDIDVKFEREIMDTRTDDFDFIWYKGTPILYSSESSNRRVHQNIHRPSDVGNTLTDDSTKMMHIYLSTIRTKKNISNLKEFVSKLARFSAKIDSKTWGETVTLLSMRRMNHWLGKDIQLRSFDDIFIPELQKKELIDSIDNFVSKRDWYVKNHIPYHFGIMLYGEAGTGKSCLAQAIKNYMNANMYVISGDDVLDLPSMFANTIPNTTTGRNNYQIILIEDIDCGFENSLQLNGMARINGLDLHNNNQNKRMNGLSSLLNSLDGIGAPQNTIYIFTTNHIEKLDKALIRPGRIDLKLEIKPVCEETFKQFCLCHYGEFPNDRTVDIKNKVTFAELQTQIMKGLTLDEIIEYVESERDEERKEVNDDEKLD